MKIKNLIRFAKISALSVGILMASCSKDTVEENSVENPDIIEGESKYLGNELIKVFPVGDGTYKMDNSDILLFENQFSDTPIDITDKAPDADLGEKLALYGGIRKWTNNTIVYKLGNLSSSVRSELFKSMDEWKNKTGIRFKEHTNESNYVTIASNGNNCNCGSANLGMNGSRGRINLGTRTTAVVIIHEIGHTLGYIHEQTRSDRDQYVKILEENIQDNALSQFRKNTRSENLGPFDIKSTMMYGAYTFSKNRKPTITLLDGTTHPRRRAELSEGDIAATNKAYPGGTVDPDTDICRGISEWSRNTRYTVGDKVTYKGYLFERDFSRWNRLGKCGDTNTNTDICEGVDAYSGSKRYAAGDQVTYNGYLYTRLNTGRWKQEGKCGS